MESASSTIGEDGGEGEEEETLGPGLQRLLAWDTGAEVADRESTGWKLRLGRNGGLGPSELIHIKEVSLVESDNIEDLYLVTVSRQLVH